MSTSHEDMRTCAMYIYASIHIHVSIIAIANRSYNFIVHGTYVGQYNTWRFGYMSSVTI